MADAISILSELRSNYCCFYAVDEPYYHTLSEAIRALSAERKGHWISLDDFRGKYNDRGYKCSECDEHSDYEENFCPNCGADMREGEKE